MSAFLGPIHHWLYNKIKVEESMLDDILEHTNSIGYDVSVIKEESIKKFGEKSEGNLEDNIATDNIHGWLQSRVASVECRLAYTITALLNEKALSKDDIIKIFIENAKKQASKVELSNPTPASIYEQIYNYLLAGMPCDRVNEVIDNNENQIRWETSIDIHKEHWNTVSGDVSLYHVFEDSWIKSFVDTLSNDFKYKKIGNINIIERF